MAARVTFCLQWQLLCCETKTVAWDWFVRPQKKSLIGFLNIVADLGGTFANRAADLILANS